MLRTTKKHAAHWAGILMCVVMLMSLLSVEAAAASVKTVSATLSPDITVKVDGTVQTFFSASGAEVHPVLYNGTTYLPLRAIGELMGKNVNWDQSTLTVTLSGTRTAAAVTGTRDTNPARQTIKAQLRPDFTIIVDGVSRTFVDAKGNTVYPMLYNGITYLPLRAIGTLMGKTVSWDSATRTASLSSSNTGSSPNGSLVTDADSFDQTPNTTQTPGQTVTPGNNTDSYIGEKKAKSIAANHAGLDEGQVRFVKARLDHDDGRYEYEIEFIFGTWEYEFEIDAYSGAILSYDRESIRN